MAQRRRGFLLVPILLVLIALGVLVAAGGFTYAASQESRDAFCASCHTQPETTFYQRSTAGQAVDLASFHTARQTRCIDCHSGAGVFGRMQAELVGARNAAKWYTGTAAQPAVLTFPIRDPNCLKCHQDVTQRGFQPKEQITIPGRGGFEGEEEDGRRQGHWHQFMARWQAASPAAGSCVSCHGGHNTTSSAATAAQVGFMDATAVQQTCDACHQATRHEEGD